MEQEDEGDKDGYDDSGDDVDKRISTTITVTTPHIFLCALWTLMKIMIAVFFSEVFANFAFVFSSTRFTTPRTAIIRGANTVSAP
ncbi:hypothetical protein BBBOND_0310040 [Babesia bigemina]|uniref:Uncharacterized protein n=1 Tax=Babesia bigemina TaxID=5866 RepID=A0A061D8R1_BABBI|nr:hypothetical protein BBBOND_0310040 [Babesia bigemina]CDR97101.1 hypothetical protein BBBOND_0310040 [Babesia bigemina]|eukprot:XP_012769287.1 hypothetical protein BBBOND_0310040 [Babesia bigemina]